MNREEFLLDLDGLWMDDLLIYILLNSVSVISGRWRLIMKDCVQWSSL